ncbi:unnamed protein product [Caenorhabditis auriculariae]|uniref:Disease resistance R13L4/SHOC-2-like LRR domain-containing protein n=1 Tax=Caenorhabditis auriculariae TaxID=2777116 RepID=A0A8S1H438_9PELO|nr:unnamed protein product [Caenorhabditis auriculariae]
MDTSRVEKLPQIEEGIEEIEDVEDAEEFPSSSTMTDLVLCDLGLADIPLRYLHSTTFYSPENIRELVLSHNAFFELSGISAFVNLITLNVASNSLTSLPDEIGCLSKLRYLDARNNLLDGLPKTMCSFTEVENINLSGNRIEQLPNAIFNMPKLRVLHLGGNLIDQLPYAIGSLTSLEILYLGGNRLQEVPATIGCLERLTSLALCDNILETIPHTLGELKHLESLSLHNNNLKTLPTEIINLRNLQQLSLRNNPLVHHFVHNMELEPPTLKELAGRVVRVRMSKLPLKDIMPREVLDYLQSACQCVNPKCKGVYFDARVEHVKFVDFCGKYRVPLLQFLCSPKCKAGTPTIAIETSSSESEDDVFQPRMRRVLLG